MNDPCRFAVRLLSGVRYVSARNGVWPRRASGDPVALCVSPLCVVLRMKPVTAESVGPAFHYFDFAGRGSRSGREESRAIRSIANTVDVWAAV